jgi:hypothetical protein
VRGLAGIHGYFLPKWFRLPDSSDNVDFGLRHGSCPFHLPERIAAHARSSWNGGRAMSEKLGPLEVLGRGLSDSSMVQDDRCLGSPRRRRCGKSGWPIPRHLVDLMPASTVVSYTCSFTSAPTAFPADAARRCIMPGRPRPVARRDCYLDAANQVARRVGRSLASRGRKSPSSPGAPGALAPGGCSAPSSKDFRSHLATPMRTRLPGVEWLVTQGMWRLCST